MSDTLSLSDVLSPDETEDDVVRGAVAELSAAFGWDLTQTWEAVRERAGGERGATELALAAAALYQDALNESMLPEFSAEDNVAASYSGDGYQDGHYVGLSAGDGYPGKPYHYDAAAEQRAAVPDEVLRLAAAHPSFFGDQDVTAGQISQVLTDSLLPLTNYESEVGRYVALAAGYSPRDLGMPPLAGGDLGSAAESAHAGSEIERLQMAHPGHFTSGKAAKRGRQYSVHNVHDADQICKTCRRRDCHSDHGQPRHGGRAHPGVKGGIFPRPHGGIGGAETPYGAHHSY